MALETVLERSTIALPKPLNLKQAEDLLSYLAKNLPGRIKYKAHYYRDIEPGDSPLQDESIGMIATIASDNPLLDTGSFESIVCADDPTKIAAIRFSPIPGYDLSEHRPEVVQLWDDVRKLIKNYPPFFVRMGEFP